MSHIDRGINRTDISPSIQKTNHEKKVAAFALATITGVMALPDASEAYAVCTFDRERNTFEVTYQKNDTEPVQRVNVSSVFAIGVYPTTEKLFSPLYSSIRDHDIKCLGVNYSIRDEQELWSFLVPKIDSVKKSFGLTYGTMAEIKPRDLMFLDTKILSQLFVYDYDLVPGTPTYDASREWLINHENLDDIIERETGVVCRHYAAAYQLIADMIIKYSKSPFLQNIFVDEVVSYSQNHAWNVIYELTKRGGQPIIQMAFLDTVFSGPKHSFSSRLIDAMNKNHESLSSAFEAQIFPSFTAEEKIDVLKGFSEFGREGNKTPLEWETEIAFAYLEGIQDFYKRNDAIEARKMFNDARVYFSGSNARYSEQQDSEQFDVLNRTILNVYVLEAKSTNDKVHSANVLDEGTKMRLEHLEQRYKVLSQKDDLKKTLKAGEEYADFLGQAGDVGGAQKFYHSLFDFYQKHKKEGFFYETAMPDSDVENALWLRIQPFQNQSSFDRYIAFKKNIVWKQHRSQHHSIRE